MDLNLLTLCMIVFLNGLKKNVILKKSADDKKHE